jgi:hypothetical protein
MIPTFAVLRRSPTEVNVETIRSIVRDVCGDAAGGDTNLLQYRETGPSYFGWHMATVPYYLLIDNTRYFESWEASACRAIESRTARNLPPLQFAPFQQAFERHSAYIVIWCLAHVVRDDAAAVLAHAGRVMSFASKFVDNDATLVWYQTHAEPFALPTAGLVEQMRAGIWTNA